MPLVNLAFGGRLAAVFDFAFPLLTRRIADATAFRDERGNDLSSDRCQPSNWQLEAMRSKRQCDLIRGV